MKKKYIELMDKTLDAYSREHIIDYFERVKREGLTEHGFPRLTANIGILIAHGRRRELTSLFLEMMDFVIESFPRGKAANDFSVKEVVFSIMALEELGGVPKEKLEEWKDGLRKIDKYVAYDIYAKTPTDKVYNWACFTAVSEYMRQYIGVCDSREFIDIQIPTQLQWIDENGMYMDAPVDPPIVYDLVPRGLFAVMLHFGYDGKYRDEMDETLRKTGLLTLNMQSVTGECAFGGRSNQFLHNEAHLAIIFEYEAKRYYKLGDITLAKRFKRAATRALDSIESYLGKDIIRHVKNNFPLESKYGCEAYAYFDKYMITAASFLYVAYLISNDEIDESDDEYLYTPSAFTLSRDFHKVFLRAGGYSIEFDTCADPHYDASGLGRVHKYGAPSDICLSVPCPATPSYTIDIEDNIPLSFAVGSLDGESPVFATGKNSTYELISLSSESDARAKFKVRLPMGKNIVSEYTVNSDGVLITLSGEGDILFSLPALSFDGECTTNITVSESSLTVRRGEWQTIYETNGKIALADGVGCNRNGHYAPYYTAGRDTLSIKVRIEKTGA